MNEDEHRTSDIEHRTSKEGRRGRVFDLEERLLGFAASIVRLTGRLSRSRAGNHIAKQLLKAGTSPLPNHGEAQAAESPADFTHKLRICLKELRESSRWLKLIQRVPLVRHPELVSPLLDEAEQLTRIFVASIRTSEHNRGSRP